ncbi:MAG: hypothetical protein DRJ49_01890 [Thermoprotei archaeon]|nr:MAG: hypothetical protein DRJ49_01890 [Thermoprotei archaeon]
MGKLERDTVLTWRVVGILLFIVFVVQPAVVYNWLVNGLWGLPIGTWMVILLWCGLTRLIGGELTRKELFTVRIFESTGIMSSGYLFAYLLRNQYFANSEIAVMFGVQKHIPGFFAPLGEAAELSMRLRTFLLPVWVQPILVNILLPIIAILAMDLTLGLISYEMYGVEEKLEFPYASWDAATIDVLIDREPLRYRALILSILAGIVYAIITYGFTIVFGIPMFMPRIIFDLTHIVENILPGACFAFSTDALMYVPGLILPLKVTTLQLIGSIGLYVLGNHIITIKDMWPLECKWKPGQGVLWNFNSSTLYFWNSFALGWGLVASILPLTVHYKSFLRSLKRVITTIRIGGGTMKSLITIYGVFTVIVVILINTLTRGFPIPILLFFLVGMSFLMTMLQTHSAGISVGFTVPYLREAMIFYSGYRNIDIWFIPGNVMVSQGGSSIAQQLRIADLLGVSRSEYIKVYVMTILLGLLGSFISVSLFWSAAEIPGHAYPYTITGWPVEAMNFWMWQEWLWTGYLFRENWIKLGALISAITYAVGEFVFHYPSMPVAMMIGMLLPPYNIFGMFVGSLLSRLISRYVRVWSRIKGYVFMGFIIGDGSVSTIIQVMALIGRAIWLKPY